MRRRLRPHLAVTDAAGWNAPRLVEAIRFAYARPFDLGAGVARADLFRLDAEDWVFLLGVHHIARDAVSMTILLDDWRRLYRAEAEGGETGLAPVAPTYMDFVRDEAERMASPEGARLRERWRAALAGAPTVLDLPTDRPRPTGLRFAGRTVHDALGQAELTCVHTAARAMGATPSTILLAAFALLLHRRSGADDILIGMPAIGRSAAFRDIVGYFANPVACRSRVEAGDSFESFATRLQRDAARALADQGLPFAELVRELAPERSAARLPLVQALFSFVRIGADRPLDLLLLPGGDAKSLDIDGLRFETFLIDQEEGQFDVTLDVIERPDQLYVALKYNSELFEAETAARMLREFRTLLERGLADPAAPLYARGLASGQQAPPEAARWNDTNVEFPKAPVDALVLEQALARPDALAVRDPGGELTHGELAALAERLGECFLHTAGASAVVALHLDPSADGIVAAIAALKTALTFVPLDPSYPAERLKFMVADSGASILVHSGAAPAFSRDMTTVSLNGAAFEVTPAAGARQPERGRRCEAPAYILYTSGSTGKPKGVRVSHESLLNVVLLARIRLELSGAAARRISRCR